MGRKQKIRVSMFGKVSEESRRARDRAEEQVFTFATIHPDITPCENSSVHLPLRKFSRYIHFCPLFGTFQLISSEQRTRRRIKREKRNA